MNIENARTKLLKAAGYIETFNTGYHARIGNYDISFLKANGGDPSPDATITCINIRRNGEQDDYQSDYFAGTYCRSLSEAIKYAREWTEKDKVTHA